MASSKSNINDNHKNINNSNNDIVMILMIIMISNIIIVVAIMSKGSNRINTNKSRRTRMVVVIYFQIEGTDFLINCEIITMKILIQCKTFQKCMLCTDNIAH